MNDGLVIQATISLLLKEHFGDRRDLYCNLMEMFNEVRGLSAPPPPPAPTPPAPAGAAADGPGAAVRHARTADAGRDRARALHAGAVRARRPLRAVVARLLTALPSYLRIVRYKTAFYSFYVPVALGLQLRCIVASSGARACVCVCLCLCVCVCARWRR